MNVLYVAWQDPEDRRWFPVGRLTRDGDVYRFVYTKGARQSPRFIPFGRMTDLWANYESTELFPLFANRLLSRDRPEYKDFVDWLNLRESEDDPLALLGRSGGIRETDSLVVFPLPEPTKGGEFHVKFLAQGQRYLSIESMEAVNRLTANTRLFLMPDPQNEHDRFAIALRTGDPKTLAGYCPRYLTADFHILLGEVDPENIKLVAERVNSEAPIQLRLLCNLTAPWPKGLRPCAGEEYQPLAPTAQVTSQPAFT